MKSATKTKSEYQDLLTALTVTKESLRLDEGKLWLSDGLDKLSQSLWDNSRIRTYGELLSKNAALCHDTINLAVTCDKIEWIRTVAATEKWDDDRWNRYGLLEIENFMIQLRSACDHLTPFIGLLSNKPIPTSFRRFRDRFLSGKYPDSPVLTELMSNTEWFPELCSIRDSITHQGGNTLILHRPDQGIQFRVAGLLGKEPYHNPIYLIGARAKFNLFAAFYFAYYIWFRDQLGTLLSKTLDVPLQEGDGLTLRQSPILSWIDDLIEKVTTE